MELRDMVIYGFPYKLHPKPKIAWRSRLTMSFISVYYAELLSKFILRKLCLGLTGPVVSCPRSTGHLSEICLGTRLRYKPSTENYPWMEEKVELSPPLGTEQNLSEFITQNLLPLLSLTFPGTLLTRSVVLGFLKL